MAEGKDIAGLDSGIGEITLKENDRDVWESPYNNKKREKKAKGMSDRPTTKETIPETRSRSFNDNNRSGQFSGTTMGRNSSKQNPARQQQSNNYPQSRDRLSHSTSNRPTNSAVRVGYCNTQTTDFKNKSNEKREFYISTMSLNYGESDLRDQCEQFGIKVVYCRPNTGKPDQLYRSFKLVVPVTDKQKVLNGSWPDGFRIHPWTDTIKIANGIEVLNISSNQDSYRVIDITPNEVGSYSFDFDVIDKKRTFKPDGSQLRYYVGPTRKGQERADPTEKQQPVFEGDTNPMDLQEGFDNRVIRECEEGLQNILKWVLQCPDRIKDVDFVLGRYDLICIISTPFMKNKSWKLSAVKFRGVIYMWTILTAESLAKDKTTEDYQRATYSGFKFEQYVTSEKSYARPDTTSPVNTNKSFHSVVSSTLNKHRLLYSAEVDCCEVDNDKSYIELKTCKELITDKYKQNFESLKLLKVWAQSYVTGVKKIVYGFKEVFKVDGLKDDGLKDDGLKDDGPKDDGPKDDGLKDDGLKDGGLKDDGPKDDGLKDDGLKDKYIDSYVVKRVKTYTTEELPGIITEAGEKTGAKVVFSKDIGLDFCDRFLSYVKKVVIEDYDKSRVVYAFERWPYVDYITADRESPDSITPQNWKFDWYPIEFLEKCNAGEMQCKRRAN